MCTASRLAHGDPLAIETSGPLPFTTAELETALAVRTQLADQDAPRRLSAHVVGDGSTVRIELSGHTRSVALDGQHGAEAARLVAVAILDLAGDQLDPPDALTPPPQPAPAIVRAPASPVPDAEVAMPWSLGIWAVSGTRTEASVELGVRIHGPLRAFAAGGAGLEQTATAMSLTVSRRTFPVRAGIAWQRGSFEARVTAIAVVESASAERSATDVIAGAGLSIVWRPARIGDVSLLVGAGADGFASSIDYRVHDMPIVSTDRVAGWAGLGLAWEPRR